MSTKVITQRRLAAFAPDAVKTALVESGKSTFTTTDVEALAGRFRDSEDFEAAKYLGDVLANLDAPVPAPRDPITAEAEDAAARAAKVAVAAKAIAAATGMPAAHAGMYAQAGFSVEESVRGWKAEMAGGQAFMFARYGLNIDQAIALSVANLGNEKVYQLLDAKVPPEQIPQLFELGKQEFQLRVFTDAGYSPADGIELLRMNLTRADEVPEGMSVAQLKAQLEQGRSRDDLRRLLKDGAFTLDEAVGVLDGPLGSSALSARHLRTSLNLSLDDIGRALSTQVGQKNNSWVVVSLLKAGFTLEDLDRGALEFPANAKGDGLADALASGYSKAELLEFWATHPVRELSEYRKAGFTIAQVKEAIEVGVTGPTFEGLRKLGYSPDEMIALKRAGYGSADKLRKEYLDFGISPADALALILAGD
ncbi:MAG: hypothetical protein IPJ65_25050 [Archangiaceae bacterium]|nr:hypothetical protein [Archangiaceae bacterium]